MIGAGLLAVTPLARAQTVIVRSITARTPNLGEVVSAASGDTVFTVSALDGSVTRSSGGGVRVSTGPTRTLVTIGCGPQPACDTTPVRVRIGAIGAPTNRARALTNFTVAPDTAQIVTAPTGVNPVDLVIGPIGRNGSKTFYVGADLPIGGEDSGQPTGDARSGFYVYAAASPQVPTSGSTVGMAEARVYRPISITKQSDLSFGAIVRPLSGAATVTVNPSSGARTLSGGAAALAQPKPSRAVFHILGEGGRLYSITRSSTMVLTSAANSITVNLTASADGTKRIPGTLGSVGTAILGIGGDMTVQTNTPSGVYTGVLTVTVSYN